MRFRWTRIGICYVAHDNATDQPSGVSSASAAGYDFYCREILQHAGFFYEEIERRHLLRALGELSILITVGHAKLSEPEKRALRTFIEEGHIWIAIGSPCGYDDLFGVQAESNPFQPDAGLLPLGEGYLRPQKECPLLPPQIGRLHFFGGTAVKATTGEVLATLQNVHGHPTPHAAIVQQESGQGLAVLIAVHLGKTIAMIQQGRTIAQDGVAPSDGSAPIEDGVLRVEDGHVLDWFYDRSREATEFPYFRTPVADCWRQILIRALFHATERMGGVLPIAWYYPHHLHALGLLSIETAESDVETDQAFLHQLDLIGARCTWCVVPPGYPLNFYRELIKRDHEVGLAFETTQAGPLSSATLHMQREQIRRAASLQQLTGVRIRNLCWQGHNAFYDGCDQINLKTDLGRGGYTPGTSGFVFGSCHPWKPIKAGSERYRAYVMPLLAHELGTRLPFTVGYELIEIALSHAGVAHFSVKSALIHDPERIDELRRLVAHGRLKGMEWWTAKELLEWEEARRGVRYRLLQNGDFLQLQLVSPVKMDRFSLLVVSPNPLQVESNTRMIAPRLTERYGMPCYALELDLAEKATSDLLFRPVSVPKAA